MSQTALPQVDIDDTDAGVFRDAEGLAGPRPRPTEVEEVPAPHRWDEPKEDA